MITKKKLEMALEKIDSFPNPNPQLEQYITPSEIASELLYNAYLKNDIEGKVVYDLGCGTGKFSIGASLLGAERVIGVDKDPLALETARKNTNMFGIGNIEFIEEDVKDIKGKADTVIQNPPFGVQKNQADRVFLEKAFEIGDVIYTMHKSSTRDFIVSYINRLGGSISDSKTVEFALKKSYKFHKADIKRIKVDIYRIRRSSSG